MSKAEWSGWVQAIGSVLAVVAGAIAVWWQVLKQASAKRDEEVRLLKIVGQFVFEVRAKLRDVEEGEIPFRHHDWTAIEAPIASIRAIPFERYPVERAAFAVANALLSYDFMRGDYQRGGAGFTPPSEAARIDKSRRHALAKFFKAEEELEVALANRRSGLSRMEIDFGNGIVVRTLKELPVFGTGTS